jgi:hypothetical protein
MEENEGMTAAIDGLEVSLDLLVEKLSQKKVNALLQEQVQHAEAERDLTVLRANQINDYIEVGLANARLATGIETQQHELISRMDSMCQDGSKTFTDDLVVDTEKVLMKQVDMSGKVLENSMVHLSDNLYKRKKEMMASYNQEEIGKLMDTHYITLKKYYEMINNRAQEMRDKYETIYFAQELESITRQTREMDSLKNRFRTNNKMEEQRVDAHKAADQLFKDFAGNVLKLKVSNSNIREDQNMRMEDTISKTKHWRFEYSHKLETSLERRIKHADELYLRTVERLDHELEALKKFKYATDMDAARVKHMAHTPLFAARRYQDEANYNAQMAPSASNLAKAESYRFKVGSRLVDLATHTKLDSEQIASELEKMLFETLVTGRKHSHSSKEPKSGSEEHMQMLLRQMIEQSETKRIEDLASEKLSRATKQQRDVKRVAAGLTAEPTIRLCKPITSYV